MKKAGNNSDAPKNREHKGTDTKNEDWISQLIAMNKTVKYIHKNYIANQSDEKKDKKSDES